MIKQLFHNPIQDYAKLDSNLKAIIFGELKDGKKLIMI